MSSHRLPANWRIKEATLYFYMFGILYIIMFWNLPYSVSRGLPSSSLVGYAPVEGYASRDVRSEYLETRQSLNWEHKHEYK